MIANKLGFWISAFRPKTLTASLIPIVVGTALVKGLGNQIQWSLSLFAFLSSASIQIGTNLINDAIDFEKGADSAQRLGPKRLIQNGISSTRSVWFAGMISFLIATLFAIPLVISGGWPIVIVGLFSILAGYAYTGGPYPLAYLGLGDLFVLIFFGWIAVGGVYFLHTQSVSFPVWIAGTQVGLLATVLIAINNFRDSLTDVQVNKKTLAVRFGPQFARFEIAGLCLIPFLMGVTWVQHDLKWASILPIFVFPFAIRLIYKIYSTEPGVIFNKYLAQSAFLQLSFGLLLGLGIVLR